MSSELEKEALQRKLKASPGSPNEILSDREESVARELLREAYGTLSSFDTEIVPVRSTPHSLKERRTEELEWIARLHAWLSPQRKVPPEILGHIFKLCVDDKSYVVVVPPRPRSLCMVLSQVCSRWRTVALAEPSVWNIVSANYQHNVRPEVLEMVLSRAGNSITFHTTMRDIPPPVLSVIRRYADKFQTVELLVRTSRNMEYIKVPFAQLGALRNLRVQVEDRMIPEVRSYPLKLYPAISAFASASNLQPFNFQLKAGEVILGQETPPLFFPWSLLQHLSIYSEMSLPDFWHIFAQCTQLVSCTVYLVGDAYHTTPPGGETCHLTSLKSLTLTSSSLEFHKVLDSITTPSLEELKIENFFTTTDTLLGLIQRSQCNIQKILIKTLSPDTERLLPAIPSLRELTLLAPIILGEAALGAISAGTLLPDLEVLECHVRSCKTVRELVSTRCVSNPKGPMGPIRKFMAWVPFNDVTDEWQEFRVSLPTDGAVQIKFGV